MYNAGHSAGWVLHDAVREGGLRDVADQDHQKERDLLDKHTTAYGDKEAQLRQKTVAS